jgi:signal transduction histidine kinase
MHPETGRTEINRAFDAVTEGWAPAASDGELILEVRRPDTPMMVGVDSDVVERIIAPLIDNAMRFARTRIVLSASPHDGAVVICVADDGPGVAVEERERIFEPGARADGDLNGHRGAGLGLPLARRLAHAIGGDVTLAPAQSGAGAEFHVRLPA